MSNQLTITDQVSEIFAPIGTELKDLLPANIRTERLQAAFTTAVSENRDILRCEPNSIRRALLKCAQDGLVPDGRRAAIVPFGGQAQYLPMVQGIIQRAKELGDVVRINTQIVCEHDRFEWHEGDDDKLIHSPAPLKDDRGEIVGAYAIFYGPTGDILHREVMSRKEIDRTRSASRASNSPAWKNWFSEMARKSVIRRGAKYVPISDELRVIVEREDEYVDLGRQFSKKPDLISKLNGADAPGFSRDFVEGEISQMSSDQPPDDDGSDAPHEEPADDDDERRSTPVMIRLERALSDLPKDATVEDVLAVAADFGDELNAMKGDVGDACRAKSRQMVKDRRAAVAAHVNGS